MKQGRFILQTTAVFSGQKFNDADFYIIVPIYGKK